MSSDGRRSLRQLLRLWKTKFRNRTGRKNRQPTVRELGQLALADFEAQMLGIGPGDICIDLGANVGKYTARMASTGCTVHAYEPDPLAFGILQKTVGNMPNVVLHQAGVAARAGTATLRRAVHFDSDPELVTEWSTLAFSNPERYRQDGIEVEVLAFRDVVQAFGRKIAVIKMDIEGSEFDILRDLFLNPTEFDVDAIFCETHEREAAAERGEVERMRRAADTIDRPHINLYWP